MELRGEPLSLSQIAAVALRFEPVEISASVHARINASRAVIDQIISDDAVAYARR